MLEKPLNQIQDQEVVSIFKHIFTEADGRQKDLLTDTPSVNNVDEKVLKLYNTGSAIRAYTKINGSLYYVQFTAV